MKPLINIDNYGEIMFRLVEDDFDMQTKIDLLQQIEKDELFKFEWESWQKTKFVDPLENYAIESSDLTKKIILIAKPQTSGRKRVAYYWPAAASILLLIGILFLLTSYFTFRPKQEVVEKVSKSQNSAKTVFAPVQNNTVTIAVANRKQFRNQRRENACKPAVADSIKFVKVDNTIAEIPNIIDSVPFNTNQLSKAPEKSSRYRITIETSPIVDNNQINNDLAQNRKVKLGKLFTNTKLFIQRKSNGEPEKLILMGDENNYLCINLSYSEK